MTRYGCHTPFGSFKDNICINTSLADSAVKLRKELEKIDGLCKHPCKFLKVTLINPMSAECSSCVKQKIGKLELSFDRVVKKTKAFRSYQFLSLLAEIGGYIGLFLGYSIYSLGDFLGGVIQKMCQ